MKNIKINILGVFWLSLCITSTAFAEKIQTEKKEPPKLLQNIIQIFKPNQNTAPQERKDIVRSSLSVPCEVDPKTEDEFVRDVHNKAKSNPELRGTKEGCKVGLRYCSQAIPEILDKISTTLKDGNSAKYMKMVHELRPLLEDRPGGVLTGQKNSCSDKLKKAATKYGFMDMMLAGYYAGKSIHFNDSKRKPAGEQCYESSPYGTETSRAMGATVCNPLDAPMDPRCLGLPITEVDEEGGHFDGVRGEQEASFLRGGWVQALKHYTVQVMREIEQGELRLISGATHGAAKDIGSLYMKDQRVSDQIVATVMEEINKSSLSTQEQTDFLQNNFCHNRSVSSDSQHLKIPDLCDEKFENETGVALEDDLFKNISRHRMSACFLAQSRAATETAFVDLATTEIIARADKHYNMLFAGAPFSLFMLSFKMAVTDPCVDAQKSCKRYIYRIPPSRSKGRQCAIDDFTSCYRMAMPAFFTAFIGAQFPANGTGSFQGLGRQLAELRQKEAKDSENRSPASEDFDIPEDIAAQLPEGTKIPKGLDPPDGFGFLKGQDLNPLIEFFVNRGVSHE